MFRLCVYVMHAIVFIFIFIVRAYVEWPVYMCDIYVCVYVFYLHMIDVFECVMSIYMCTICASMRVLGL